MSRRKSKKFVTAGKQPSPHGRDTERLGPIPGETEVVERRIELLTGVVLFAFGVYHSVLYFGHTAVPNGDFPDFFRVGKELFSLEMPKSFKLLPVLGLVQNLLVFVSWGPVPILTAGWLLNAILHPFSVVLLWLVGKRVLGRSAVWFAIIVAINPWTIYSLTEPITETIFLFFVVLTFYLIFRRSRWAYLFASVASMVRYEGVALIFAAFVADIINRENRRDIIKAIGYSALASVPFVMWMALTAVTWHGEQMHYFNVLFSKEYAKGFLEPVKDRTGVGLHLRLLWRTGFQSLLIPYAGASSDFAEMLFKLSKTAGVVGFLLGCVFAFLKRRREIPILLSFFLPYFMLHAYYPYPLMRFHSTTFWMALLVAWFGLQSAGEALALKARLPRQVVLVPQIALTIAAWAWLAGLVRHFADAAAISPASASVPYVSMAVVVVIVAVRMSARRFRFVPRQLCVASVMCLVIASNQFILAQLLGDGKREIEFKLLGEWFASDGRPDEKMAVYLDGPTRLFAGKNAQNVVGFPEAASPTELVEKLRKAGVTYVVWATREGFSRGQHTGYQLLGLHKNIAFLDKPRSIGCYEFVRPLGSERGFVNIFRLGSRGEDQLPGEAGS
jgi:hypothetical protein